MASRARVARSVLTPATAPTRTAPSAPRVTSRADTRLVRALALPALSTPILPSPPPSHAHRVRLVITRGVLLWEAVPALRALSTRNDDPKAASRPWDRDRDGFVMGEGSAVLVLEEYEHAKKRGAKIYAELCGYAATADANHITAPTVEGPLTSMQMALGNAGINKDEVGYVNAHGTSTPVGDINETKATKACFGDHASKLLISSTKSMTGHLLGAASAIEAVFSIMAIHDGIVPPTINIFNQDPECDLDYVANTARAVPDLKVVMSNSFGFGGTNSTVIFRKI